MLAADEIAGCRSDLRQRLVVVTFAAWNHHGETKRASYYLSWALIDIKAPEYADNIADVHTARQGSLSSGSEYGPAMTPRRERPPSWLIFGIGTVAITVVPRLPDSIANCPPSCLIRSRIPATPTPRPATL